MRDRPFLSFPWRTLPQRFAAILVAACLAAPCGAADWKWLASFTDASSPELVELHEKIYAPSLPEGGGFRIDDAHWQADYLDLHLQEGTLVLERPLEGAVVGAYFAGKGTMSFRPPDRRTEEALRFWFGARELTDLTFTHALFFSLREQPLEEQFGLQGEPTEPRPDTAPYEEGKRAQRQLGTSLVHAFLNRDGLSRDTVYVLLAVQEIRTPGSEQACLLYSYDPNRKFEVELDGFGHKEVAEMMPHKFFFHSLVEANSKKAAFEPQGRVAEYVTDLSVGTGKYSAVSSTTIRFVPSDGVSALRASFTPRMKVTKVTGADGGELPFLQWRYLDNDPNYDANVIVRTGELEEGEPYEITVQSEGSLFEPYLSVHWLAEEDTWYPALDDPDGSIYELTFHVPKLREAVGVGELIGDEVVDGDRRYHFRTSRPHRGSTMYFGDFVTDSIQADDTTIEAHIARTDTKGRQNLKHVLTELSNMVKVYNRLFVPIEMPVLRVAGTPTNHGRGFEGLILLGERGGFGTGSSGQDVFRAHEVAHMWWGGIVEPRDWSADRWIGESFAEYAAMEYYRHRFEGPGKVRELIHDNWVYPTLRTPQIARKTLPGEASRDPVAEFFPLVAGTDNVYTKGPEVLHMLRYLFRLQKQNDDAFWEMLRDFLQTYRYQTVTTADFIRTAEKHLGTSIEWFWEQWVYGSEIPDVQWEYDLQPSGDKWTLTVKAEQDETGFVLWMPVYIHFKGDRLATKPIKIDANGGTLSVVLPEKPTQVSLNDDWEVLAQIRKK